MIIFVRTHHMADVADIEALKAQRADLQGQIDDYRKNMAAAKKTAGAYQTISDDVARILTVAEAITDSATIGANDEKIISDLVRYYNAGGVRRQGTGDSETGGQVLSSSHSSDAARARWPVKRLATDIIAPLIEDNLQLRKTIQCYEGDIK